MIRKGKRAKITQEGRELIFERSLEHPRIPRTILAEQLQRELEAKGKDVPQVEVLERKISWFRNHASDNPQDKPWSMSTLDKYPISPEALPFLLRYYADHQHSTTIRLAKWVSRLYAVTGDDEQSLDFFVEVYEWKKRIAELTGATFDSSSLDHQLLAYSMGDKEAARRLHERTFLANVEWRTP